MVHREELFRLLGQLLVVGTRYRVDLDDIADKQRRIKLLLGVDSFETPAAIVATRLAQVLQEPR